jgi:hypothetical protein
MFLWVVVTWPTTALPMLLQVAWFLLVAVVIGGAEKRTLRVATELALARVKRIQTAAEALATTLADGDAASDDASAQQALAEEQWITTLELPLRELTRQALPALIGSAPTATRRSLVSRTNVVHEQSSGINHAPDCHGSLLTDWLWLQHPPTQTRGFGKYTSTSLRVMSISVSVSCVDR